MSSAPVPVIPPSPEPVPPTPPRPPSARGLFAVGVVSVSVAMGGVAFLATTRSHAEAREAELRRAAVAAGPRLRAVKVTLAASGRDVTLPAEARAWAQATLYAKVSGYLRDIRVDKGDRVKKGQLLATLESPDTEQQVAAARADLDVKRQLLQRHLSLVSTGVSSQQQVDDAQAGVKISEANLARAQSLQSYGTLTAPFEGIVTARYVDTGALLPAATGSTTSAQPVLDLADMDKLRIYVYLGQDDADSVHEGDAVTLSVDQRPGQTIEAKVTRMTRNLDARTRTMLCEVDIDNKDVGLYPGSFIHATLHLQARPYPMVPAEALFMRADKQFVAVVQDGRARVVPVVVGRHDGKVAQIVSGLQGGEVVALNAGSDVTDGGPVDAVLASAEKR
ncbi:efflux RND transporter periplasmic adaptor subunit [Corallococcus sp. M34]|uniref:efflux RND transporter periplasmic adaptor subunit n=1 Tax=Citreicoccus inhibens TaxID=2849499 RepID=UPI001C246D0B|nr:efflux RND transporter periplasmic adaptor subunit [Citreicoccus inhibens]MBU8898580.1 efflux RND transporter periplasmic adaptor subunit [Citreicoccus inhibens]